VDRDFGLVGTVTDAADPDKVKVAFKGGGRGVPPGRWLKKGQVFALVAVSAGAAGRRTTRVPWALLQVQEPPGDEGTCVCQLFPRTRSLAASGSVLGYRCLKLGTTRAPLRIRLVKANAPVLTPAPNLQVRVRRHGFTSEDGDGLGGASDAEGYFSTEPRNVAYDNVAFVTVLVADTPVAQVPLPILDGQTVVLPTAADAASTLVFRKRLWEQGVVEEQLMLDDLFKDLNTSLDKADVPKTKEKAQGALDRLNRALETFTRTRDELAAAPAPGGKRLDLAKGNAYLKDVEKARDDLTAFIARLDKAMAEANDPKRQEARKLFEQARLLEDQQAEYGKALELYEKVLADGDDAKLRERVGRLKEAWKPKDDRHAAAREFIYETWPKVEPSAAAMRKAVKEAEGALEVCEQAKDPLGPRRLLKVATDHAAQLTKQLGALSPDVTEDDRKPAEELTEVLESLANLIKKANAYVAKTPVP
jgi:hypothetical protein